MTSGKYKRTPEMQTGKYKRTPEMRTGKSDLSRVKNKIQDFVGVTL